MTDDLAQFRRAREQVLGRIADACARAGRDAESVTLVAVSKTVAADRIRTAVEAGFTVLGENRVQELAAKAPDVPGATWHLIGPLQSNKARKALEVASIIESVDSLDLARRLDRIAHEIAASAGAATGAAPPRARVPVFLQVNVDEDPAKFGFQPEAVDDAVAALADLDALELRGLMTVGRLVEAPEAARPTFAGLRRLSDEIRARRPGLGPELSMGMSEDYPIGVEEGATVVRVGRAIFGARPPA